MMTSALSSQRFCLRWNNHQSNLLTVFDQLLHDESFVDVTLAVEGRLLKAHKMVLSACSPYFQALFVGHPDKHPIVILKDVPYCDMKSLLDFMYRGEVSVDQERLTAFLKVAESLRIKGLTEVNEEKYDLPSIASSLLSAVPPPVVTTHTPPPPPHLHRIHPIPSHRRNLPMPSATPLLGSALTAPKRKRGRPRKLSGSSGGAAGAQPPAAATATATAAPAPVDGTPTQKVSGNGDAEGSARTPKVPDPVVTQGSPEMLEVRMSVDFQQSGASGGRPPDGEIGNDTAALATEPSSDQADTQQKECSQPPAKKIKDELEPTPGPSSQDPGEGFGRQSGTTDSEQFSQVKSEEQQSEYDSSLPEDENELITLSPSSSTADVRSGEEPASDAEAPVREGARNGVGERGPSGRNRVVAMRNEKQNSWDAGRLLAAGGFGLVAEELLQSGLDSVLSDEEPGSPSDKSVRQFCTREADNVFRCKICSKTYTHISNFCRHYLTTHGPVRQVFACPLCGKEFTRRDNMMTHLKALH
ncbi:protein tramtrack, beta isoform-like isoform X1 [Bacillus rossius redtenbacheri]|uniref:protein tramtrack, beta isoform-like isoform X1 n=1 Tax=Bacillus rossius redtenbacheri TaxID=93214 RepID=UPI002FDCB206